MADVNKADDIADEVYPNPKENLEDTLAEQDIARELETDLKSGSDQRKRSATSPVPQEEVCKKLRRLSSDGNNADMEENVGESQEKDEVEVVTLEEEEEEEESRSRRSAPTTPRTPKASREEKEKRRLEREREMEARRLEKERIQQEKKREAEEKRLKREKLKQEEEERKEQKRKEEEERREKKRKEEEEKEEARRRKEEERLEKKRKEEEEKKKKEEERLAKKLEEEHKLTLKKKEEEAMEERKRRESNRFLSFFRKEEKKEREVESNEKEGQNMTATWFRPYQLKEGWHLAPIFVRERLDSSADVFCPLKDGEPSYLESIKGRELKGKKPFPLRAKMYHFADSFRPPWFGTWRKKGEAVKKGRRPFGKEKIMDYDVDSDLDWEEEPSDAEECKSDEEEDEAPEMDGDEDDGFLVEHGYLSEGEGESPDEDEADEEPTDAPGDCPSTPTARSKSRLRSLSSSPEGRKVEVNKAETDSPSSAAPLSAKDEEQRRARLASRAREYNAGVARKKQRLQPIVWCSAAAERAANAQGTTASTPTPLHENIANLKVIIF